MNKDSRLIFEAYSNINEGIITGAGRVAGDILGGVVGLITKAKRTIKVTGAISSDLADILSKSDNAIKALDTSDPLKFNELQRILLGTVNSQFSLLARNGADMNALKQAAAKFNDVINNLTHGLTKLDNKEINKYLDEAYTLMNGIVSELKAAGAQDDIIKNAQAATDSIKDIQKKLTGIDWARLAKETPEKVGKIIAAIVGWVIAHYKLAIIFSLFVGGGISVTLLETLRRKFFEQLDALIGGLVGMKPSDMYNKAAEGMGNMKKGVDDWMGSTNNPPVPPAAAPAAVTAAATPTTTPTQPTSTQSSTNSTPGSTGEPKRRLVLDLSTGKLTNKQ